MNNESKDRWLLYLAKLIEREFSRRRASGITTWAIYGTLGILFYHIFPNIPKLLYSLESAQLLIISITFINNLIIAFVLMILPLLMWNDPSREIRLKSGLARSSEHTFKIVTSAILIIIIAFNLYSFKFANKHGLPLFSFLVITIFFFFQLLLFIISIIKTYLRSRRIQADLPELQVSGYFLNIAFRRYLLISWSTLGIFFTVITIIAAIRFASLESPPFNYGFILNSIEIIAFMFLLLYLFLRSLTIQRLAALESLERRIIMENLREEEIMSNFTKLYLGERISEWIKKSELRLQDLCKNYISTLENVEKELSTLSNINSQYTYEIKGRKKEICSKTNKPFEEYNNYCNSLIEQLEHLKDQHILLADSEILGQIISTWEKQNHEIKSKQNLVCEHCNDICDSINQNIKTKHNSLELTNGNNSNNNQKGNP